MVSMLAPLRNVAVVLGISVGLACNSGGGGGGGSGEMTPLVASSDGRRLVQGSGAPLLILGDAPQSLIVNVSVGDASFYFSNRAAQGFNAAWVNVLCEPYTGGRPDGSTYDGIRPFNATLSGGLYDLSTPNLLRANGLTAAREYGRFLGRRYKNASNIVWMSGNDFRSWQDVPSDDELVFAVAQGIRDEDPRHLQTTELGDPLSSSLDDPRWRGLLGINNTYTYFPTYAQLYVDWRRNPHLPNVFIEGNYEGEQLGYALHVTAPFDCRNEYWWAMTSGAAGEFYGNRWVHDFLPDWQSHLHDLGAEQVQHVRNLLAGKRWYELIPDIDHVVATAGYGTFSDCCSAQNNDFVTTARTPDGSLVVSYFPVPHSLVINMATLSGPATASWYDPTTGNTTANSPALGSNAGTHAFTPPAVSHADGSSDWVLVLEVH